MAEDTKRNLQYFEAPTMRELYDCIRIWQNENRKRFLAISIENDTGTFCCIALTNPSEVVITSADGDRHARIDATGCLHVSTY